ncbi:hypothetical protein [Borrelia sp. RT1S]|uniref:hypothetical protein n=1 Tax=Borrelia sp. RT1S TaxID=2898580 RepID=UPI001E5B93A3|nr:hypothetical protein [Borrelia sp. RT1S]UGQ17875.1 hypothetical protein LSO05_05435 [Borrelia sp. RT1S]
MVGGSKDETATRDAVATKAKAVDKDKLEKLEVNHFVNELVDQEGYDIDYMGAFLVDAGYLLDTEVTRVEFMEKFTEFMKGFC